MINMQKLDIQIDWRAFVAGDERIFERVYHTFFDAFYNYGRKYTSNTALVEDTIHDLFVRFWKNRANLNEPPSLKNYLFRAFRNHMFDRLRVDGKYVTDELGDHYKFDLAPSPEETRVMNEHEKAVHTQLATAMKQVSDRQREALFLRFYAALSYEEIAATMGITVKATYKLMARSIDAMRKTMDGNTAHLLYILIGIKNLKITGNARQ